MCIVAVFIILVLAQLIQLLLLYPEGIRIFQYFITIEGTISASTIKGTSSKQHSTNVDKNSMPHFAAEVKHNPSVPLTAPIAVASISTIPSATENTSNWKKGTFCYNYFVNTFQLPIPVCASSVNPSVRNSISCLGSPYSDQMATCTLENIIISPHLLGKTMKNADNQYMEYNKSELSIALLDGCGTECHITSIDFLQHQVHYFDYVLQVIQRVKEAEPQPAEICKNWIEDDVFFFTAQRAHIYFLILDYFSLHKLLQDVNHTQSHGIHIMRISGSNNYLFPKFGEALFPEAKVHTIDNLNDVKTCFKKVVLVPKGVHSFPFRCKMSSKTVQKCLDCNAKGLSKTPLNLFRTRVLKACSVSDQRSSNITRTSVPSIIYLSRKPYMRFKSDKLDHFTRVLSNEKELILELRKTLKPATVRQVQLEDYELCDQIRIVHDADIYIGVHGAGLVHLWWLKEDSLVYELEPQYMVSNPTFRTLASLSGHKYKSINIGSGTKYVNVNIGKIVKDLKKYLNL